MLSIIAELMDKDPVLEGTVYLDEKLIDVNHVGTKQNDKKNLKSKELVIKKRI